MLRRTKIKINILLLLTKSAFEILRILQLWFLVFFSINIVTGSLWLITFKGVEVVYVQCTLRNLVSSLTVLSGDLCNYKFRCVQWRPIFLRVLSSASGVLPCPVPCPGDLGRLAAASAASPGPSGGQPTLSSSLWRPERTPSWFLSTPVHEFSRQYLSCDFNCDFNNLHLCLNRENSMDGFPLPHHSLSWAVQEHLGAPLGLTSATFLWTIFICGLRRRHDRPDKIPRVFAAFLSPRPKEVKYRSTVAEVPWVPRVPWPGLRPRSSEQPISRHLTSIDYKL